MEHLALSGSSSLVGQTIFVGGALLSPTKSFGSRDSAADRLEHGGSKSEETTTTTKRFQHTRTAA